ncbi:helix-turn-helix domain-containing protein [Acinetobacter baumannii]|uniref:helix-turn-helix domain-containing protein n=1 Tax=Acinetobacter calcoaceticus/baumannii complex TaxID=909768 RepID=UPI0018696510|nr:helix-turn-helix domain-containing protein [Acinetobacter baumannii]EIB7122441.1 helix-turn-helix domain-containing protein [Acinetobacter baumannii]MCY2772539.1 helix-turn-helix domain-containing protein [Acinetobacter baumannii]MCY2775764.1 helix-turn-helix domain-containing protein [Acinetobacter baumannii]MCY2798932.1 helix-turn-helix domain-containing protein [Acinetobacter baumannii]MCY2805816.1 helix-turn-helix domain-containing protein [Acinetobacter baumannii]
MKNLETMGQRIRALRREKKLTQGELAKIAGVSAPNVTGWEKDAYAPKADPLSKMAAYFGVSTSYITNGDESGPKLDSTVTQLKVLDIEAFKKKYNIPDSEDAVKFLETPVKSFPTQKRYVPVKAYSKMGMDGYFTDMGYEGNAGDGYVPTHSAGPRAYGIKGTGDSMFPAIRNGWYVVCDPDADLVPTEFVQVCLKDGRCTIKEFIGINNDVLSLIAVNGGERLTFPMDEVESITAITDIVPPSQHRQEYPYG